MIIGYGILPLKKAEEKCYKVIIMRSLRFTLCVVLLAVQTLGAQELSFDKGLFQKGDNPAWSAPAFDDSAWQEVTFKQSW